MAWLARREFLGVALGAGSALALGPLGAAPGKSRVVAAKGKSLFKDERTLDPKAVKALVDRAVATLVGENDPQRAWKRLVKPDDLVGIKVNCLAGARLSTRIEVVRAVAEGVRSAGVPTRSIFVWDRKLSDMVRARYPVEDRSEFICIGNDHRNLGFGPPIILKGVIGSLFSRLVTDVCSVIINVPVLKDHDLAGVSLSLKSAFGAIHNPNKYHFATLHQAIVDVNRVEPLRRKTVVHICDATFGCAQGGPTPAPRWLERPGMVYASRDPVALDTVLWAKIEELRKARGLPSLVGSKREPKHIALGAEAGLGTNEQGRIEVVSIEV